MSRILITGKKLLFWAAQITVVYNDTTYKTFLQQPIIVLAIFAFLVSLSTEHSLGTFWYVLRL